MKLILPDTKHGTVEDLEKWIKEEKKNSKLANHLNAIRLLMLNYQQKEVAIICGVSRKSIQKWLKKWNAAGKEGLISSSGGSRSKVTETMRADITQIIDVKKEIDGRTITGKLICGYLKKNTH